MKFETTAALVALILPTLLLSGCIVTKDSPAPGCVETIGFVGAGGCFGTTAILDLAVTPRHECLEITVNNCNGGVLEVRNSCDEVFAIGGVLIPPSERASLDLFEGHNGEYLLRDVSSNFSDYVPPADTRIELSGLLGDQDVRVSFTKTAQLCDA